MNRTATPFRRTDRRGLRAALLAGAAMLALAVATPPAHAQVDSREGIALQNQILELRHQVEEMRAQQGSSGGGGSSLLGGGSSAPPRATSGGNDMTAQLVARVGTLEEQVRELRGRIEDLQNQVQTQNAQLGKRIDDLSFNLQNGQAGGAAAGGGLAAAAAPAAPAVPAAPPMRTPEVALQQGHAALARRDYAAAESDARSVIATDKTSPRAYDAQLLLAQALYGQRQYSQAAIAYDDTYNHAKKGPHAQDALLGLANSLIAINQKKAACATLFQLHSGFPTPRADLRAPIASAAKRAGCS